MSYIYNIFTEKNLKYILAEKCLLFFMLLRVKSTAVKRRFVYVLENLCIQ